MLQCIQQGIERPLKKLATVARREALGQIVCEERRERENQEVDEAAAAFGLVAVFSGDDPPEPLYLWPENAQSWNLFLAVSTQWIAGTSGVIGLNYPGVEVVMRKWRIKRQDEQKVFSEIQVMEHATLRAWSERKK